jgi:hypothetical protein
MNCSSCHGRYTAIEHERITHFVIRIALQLVPTVLLGRSSATRKKEPIQALLKLPLGILYLLLLCYYLSPQCLVVIKTGTKSCWQLVDYVTPIEQGILDTNAGRQLF